MIKEEVAEQGFSTWFEPIVPLKLQNNILTIQVPSQFFYEWLEEHYVRVLKKALEQSIGPGAKLEYSVIVDRGDKEHAPVSINLPNRSGSSNRNGRPAASNPFELESVSGPMESQLNQHYIFETFVEGDCNRLARSAGHAVARKPGVTSFNPLMIYGGVGLGKTHLVHAIGNEVKENLPDKLVQYVSSEKFINQFIKAVQNNEVQSFQNYYLQCDVLIIDDVQFFGGKEKTQEIFFHIFNHLHQSGKQIVMTSDRAPRELKGLEERLLSRFKWGLTTDLQQPDYETRMAIIQNKMESEGLTIPPEVCEYLAVSVDTNVRELEGVMISLLAHASLDKKDIDLELAKEIMQNIVHDIETEVGIDYIQKMVAEYFHLSPDELKAKTRKKEIVIARQTAMHFSKEYTNLSLKSIGQHFGGRDHSTVLHALQAVQDMIDVDSSYRGHVESIQNKLRIQTA